MKHTVLSSVAAALATTCLSPATQAQATQADSAPSWTADDVVVTGTRERYGAPDAASATRTNTPLIETPQSVQVLTRTLLEEQDRRTLGDALVNVSGVTPTRPEENLFTQPIVRGFASEIYVDGLPAFGTNANIDPNSLAAVERIEVVKGPTSTIYAGGAGAPLGGLINVVSKRPEVAFGGFVAVRAGSYATLNPYADLNLPLTDGIAARITGEYTEAEVTKDTAIPIGDRLTRVPKHSGRVAARYRVLDGAARGLSFGAGVTAFTAREITLPNSVSVPGYAAVDAQAAYDIGRFTIQAAIVNLGGRRAFDAYQYLGIPVVIPVQPRSAYLTLKARI